MKYLMHILGLFPRVVPCTFSHYRISFEGFHSREQILIFTRDGCSCKRVFHWGFVWEKPQERSQSDQLFSGEAASQAKQTGH